MEKNSFFESIISKKNKISIVGLGYVGLPLAIAFDRFVDVIGFDLNSKKIEKYINGIDPTKEVGDLAVKNSKILFSSNEQCLRDSKFHIVAVPTPINLDHSPNLNPVIEASKIVGKNLAKDSIVVYESTVYPGVTEDVCIPILESYSGLKAGVDFKVGYSPERINPGDREHRLNSIVKIVSGMDEDTLELVSKVYGLVIDAGVYKANSIKVAEAAKVIENSQRDINIAFMNELSIIFNKMGIDTREVLEAAKTKWNFLNFYPGLVGGHCIGVDPYYLTYKADCLGYHSQVILSGRKINDSMGKYIAENTIKCLVKSNKNVNNSKVLVLGYTFKENCPDIRNTKVQDIIDELLDYNLNVCVYDPVADLEGVNTSISFVKLDNVKDFDCIIVAVAHDEFKKMSISEISSLYKDSNKVLVDVKGIFDKNEFIRESFIYWSL